MTGRILPRYLVLAAALSVVVAGLMLSIFYGQYRWLAGGIVDASVDEHLASLSASFERRARGRLHRIADDLAELSPPDATHIERLLADAVAVAGDELVGLRYETGDGAVFERGSIARGAGSLSPEWTPERLHLTYPVTPEDLPPGRLVGSFELTDLATESSAFEQRLLEQETRYVLSRL